MSAKLAAWKAAKMAGLCIVSMICARYLGGSEWNHGQDDYFIFGIFVGAFCGFWEDRS